MHESLIFKKFPTSAKASAKSLDRSITGRSRAATMRTFILAGILISLFWICPAKNAQK